MLMRETGNSAFHGILMMLFKVMNTLLWFMFRRVARAVSSDTDFPLARGTEY